MINILMQVRQGVLSEAKEDTQMDGIDSNVKLEAKESSSKRTWSDDEIAAQLKSHFTSLTSSLITNENIFLPVRRFYFLWQLLRERQQR